MFASRSLIPTSFSFALAADCPCPGRIRIPDGRHGVEEPIRDNPPPANPGGRAGIGEPIIDNKPPPHRNPGGRAGIDEPIIDNPRKGMDSVSEEPSAKCVRFCFGSMR